MVKIRFPKSPAAAMLLVAISATQAMAGGSACDASEALRQRQCPTHSGALLLIRDTQSAGRGGGNSCWTSCFNNFNECVAMRPKTHCVATMKLCLENCDRLAGRSGQ